MVSVLQQITSEFDFLACFLSQPPAQILYYSRNLSLEDAEIHLALAQAEKKGPEAVRPFEFEHTGKTIYGLGITIPMPEGEMAILGILSFDDFRDNAALIQDLRTLSHYLGLSLEHAWLVGRLTESNQHLKKLDNLKNEFINNVTHELKTPLSTIKLAAQTLATRPSQEMRGDIVKIILTEADRLNRLISDVLSVSKVEGDTVAFENKVFKPRDVVAEVFESLRLMASDRRIKMELEAPPEIINGDMSVFRQIAANLISNAIKYTRPGTVVKVELFFEPSEWSIRVTDQGEGISEADQERLFTPFYRVENTHQKVEGTGLGLYLIAKLAQNMGGLAGVHSEVAKGSCFWVILPRALSLK